MNFAAQRISQTMARYLAKPPNTCNTSVPAGCWRLSRAVLGAPANQYGGGTDTDRPGRMRRCMWECWACAMTRGGAVSLEAMLEGPVRAVALNPVGAALPDLWPMSLRPG
jgi:hypothetical protein